MAAWEKLKRAGGERQRTRRQAMRRALQEAKSQNGVLASRYVALLGCMLAKLGCGCRHLAQRGANRVETCILERILHFGLGAAAPTWINMDPPLS